VKKLADYKTYDCLPMRYTKISWYFVCLKFSELISLLYD